MEDGRSFRCALAEIFRSKKLALPPLDLRHFGQARAVALPRGLRMAAREAAVTSQALLIRPEHRSPSQYLANPHSHGLPGEFGFSGLRRRLLAAYRSIQRRPHQVHQSLPTSLATGSWRNTPTISEGSFPEAITEISLENRNEFTFRAYQYVVCYGRINPLYRPRT
jgi:hypothetical protein